MTAIMPAQVRKPKQKAPAEGTVGDAATWIIAALREKTFTQFDEVVLAVRERIAEHNAHPFQKRQGSRDSVFTEAEADHLRPLPDVPYDVAEWVYNRSVNLDFHVVYAKNRYSVPYRYAGRKVDPRVGEFTIGIYHAGERIATHKLLPTHCSNRYSTDSAHMPEAFAKPGWDDVQIRRWAASVGPECAAVIERIFCSVKLKEQAYNPTLSVLRLSKKYGSERLEAACGYALQKVSSPRYKHVKSVLDANFDREREGTQAVGHTEQRSRARRRLLQRLKEGASKMIDDETRRKLHEMGMSEMLGALDMQETDRTCMALAFDERVRMAVDYVYEEKHAASVKRLPGRARLRFPDAEMGSMIYEGRGIDGILIRGTGVCQFMDNNANVVIEGRTGTGKSYLACCLAKQACRMRRSARYVRLPDLLMERDELAGVERSDVKMLKKYARFYLLVLDEWLTEDVRDVDIRFLLELIERRYMDKSTVLRTQYSPAEWHGRLGGGAQADAMVDRLVQGSVRIDLGDVNVRKLLSQRK